MDIKKKRLWLGIITGLVVFISVFHYATPTLYRPIHLIYMELYFVPILVAAFQFGIRGGVATSLAVSLIYFPHIMLQWGGGFDNNLLRFLQIVMFNVIGYLTGLKAQRENEEKVRCIIAAERLEKSLQQLKTQSEQLAGLDEQIRLMDRLALVGELTASLAHEVRNPLGSIRGAVEILREELPEASRNSEFFQILIQETERLNAVVENYLGFARKPVRQPTSFEAITVIRNACAIVTSRARKTAIDFHLEIPDTECYLEGDPNDLRQVLVNLIINAIQAMDDGGSITVEVKKAPRDDAKKIESSGNFSTCLELRVMDNGPGIPEDKMEKIFEPFFTTKTNGTGLGLSIVRRICEQNEWKIRVNSRPGEGAEFEIRLPAPSKVPVEAEEDVS